MNNDLGAVSILATYAQRKGGIDERPTIEKLRSTVRIRYLASDEIARYMAEIRPAFRPLFQLLIGSGMQIGEAEGPRMSDFQLGDWENRVMIEDAKCDAGVRSLFVPGWVADTMAEHLDRHGRAGTDRVFQIPRRTVQKEHNRARKQIGRLDYTVHDHRHTAAVQLPRSGLPLHLLQQHLGHASIDQTMRYATFHPDYGDVGPYPEKMAKTLGITEGPGDKSRGTENSEAREGSRE